MTARQEARLHDLQGRALGFRFADGSRVDDATLVSVSTSVLHTAWICAGGEDLLVPLAEIIDYWEAGGPRD